jgi:uncharacterized repeat protein (TIGR01451 family)
MPCACENDIFDYSVAPDGCITLFVHRVDQTPKTMTFCPGDNVTCDAAGIRINGVLCPFPVPPAHVLTCVVDPTDACYSTLHLNGNPVGCRFLNQPKVVPADLHAPATITSPDSTINHSASGLNNQAFALSVNTPALISGTGGNSLVVVGDKLYVPTVAQHPPANVTTADPALVVTPNVAAQTFNIDFNELAAVQEICGNPTAKAALLACIADPVAALSITKSAAPAAVAIGAPVTYTLVVTNSGPASADGATVTDILGPDFNLTGIVWSYSSGAGGGSGTIPSFSIATLPPNSTATLAITGSYATAGNYDNVATVTPPHGRTDPNLANNIAQSNRVAVAQPVTPMADLSVVKVASTASVVINTPMSYTVTITNNGPSAANGATVSDTLPAAFVPTSQTWAYSGGAGGATGSAPSYTIATLPSGGVATLTIAGSYSALGSYTNTAVVSPPAGVTDPTNGNNSASSVSTTVTAVPVPKADLQVVKTQSSTSVQVNTPFTYTVTVTNLGPDAANGATMTDTLPNNFTLASAVWSYTGGAGGGAGAVPNFSIATLPSGGVATLTVTGQFTAVGSYINSASVAAPAGVDDTVIANNTSTTPSVAVSAVPVPQANLSIAKTQSATTATVNTNFTYTLTVTNAGPDAADGATVTDNFPSNFTVGSVVWAYSGGAGGASGSAPNFTIATMPSGGQAVATVVGQFTAAGNYTNTATTATPAGVNDPVPANNTASTPSVTVSVAPVFLPTATVTVADNQPQANVSMTLGGSSHASCPTPGITAGTWTVLDASAAVVATGSSLPGAVVVDLSAFTGPFTARYQVTDACGTSALATDPFTCANCASTVAGFSSTSRYQYYVHSATYNSAGTIAIMNSTWGLTSANDTVPNAGHTRLGQAAYPDIISGISLGVPSLKAAAATSSLVASTNDTNVGSLDPLNATANAEMGIHSGSLYADCSQVAGTTYKFRAFAGSANAECYAAIWNNSGPAAANTATDDSYSLTTTGAGPVTQTETAAFAITGPLHRFGFAYFNLDSGGNNDSRLQVSKNGGAFQDLKTLADVAAVGLVLNNV